MVVVAGFTAILSAAAVESKEIVMRSPPVKIDEHERILDSNEIAALRCAHIARRIVSDRDGIVMSSERVSHSEEFGYVFRYDIVRSLDDDRGRTHRSHSVFLLWTEDCETFLIASHAMYQLPDLRKLQKDQKESDEK